MERVTQASRLAAMCQPIERAASAWLASYPIFEDVLRCGETTFRELPDYAKMVALKRMTIDVADHALASKVLDNVCVSFIELCTDAVSVAVDSYLGREQREGNASGDGLPASPESLVERIPTIDYPLTERPPCLLRAGHHVFLDGWMRFFSYRTRGDRTIPLLALDWLDFHHRLGVQLSSQPTFNAKKHET